MVHVCCRTGAGRQEDTEHGFGLVAGALNAYGAEFATAYACGAYAAWLDITDALVMAWCRDVATAFAIELRVIRPPVEAAVLSRPFCPPAKYISA